MLYVGNPTTESVWNLILASLVRERELITIGGIKLSCIQAKKCLMTRQICVRMLMLPIT